MNKYSNKKARRNIKVIATIMLVLFVLNRIGNLLLLKTMCSNSEAIVISIMWQTIVGAVTVGAVVVILLIVCFIFYELYEHFAKRNK